ncbi:hypothetical protein E4T47_06139 [Aureobasidium subglaciale]|nr:hypothetical protein E4T43_06092 [Aureobasidium subglaciale]KAI5270492.1 hypothetical protein E4T47_06139 [Aureobasidium subglaciale]
MASVWYANGTAIDIVKLEGGPEYKHLMRSVIANPDLPKACSEQASQSMGVMLLQDYLPSFATGSPLDPDVETVNWMLRGLKGATEAFVEEPLTAVRISTNLPRAPMVSILQPGVESLGLKYMETRMEATTILSILGLEGKCDSNPYKLPDQMEVPDDPPRLYLAIDYSRSGISAFLAEEDCGIGSVLRSFRNTSLGVEADFPGKLEDLTHALKHLTRQPVDEWGWITSSHISELVLLGESTNDTTLDEALQHILQANYTNLKARSDQREKLHHASFVGSRAVAMSCQRQLEVERDYVWDARGGGNWLEKDIWEAERRKWWWNRRF